MIRPINNIAFGGIYDFVVPKGTPKEKIDAKVEQTQKLIRDNLQEEYYTVVGFNDRIRLVSAVDSPTIITGIFNAIGGEDLARQYISRNRQEYRLNLQI